MPRPNFIAGLDVEGSSVCVIGANLGEVSRDLRRAGASTVDAYEDGSSALPSRLTPHDGLDDVNCFQADLSKGGFLRRDYDVCVALSACSSIRRDVDYIGRHVSRAVLIETGEVEGANWPDVYIRPLTRHFPHWCCLARLDHHIRDPTSQRPRLWLAFSREHWTFASYGPRARDMATDAEGILEIDLRRSRLEFLKRAQLPLELRHHPLDPSALRRYAERLGKYERELSSGRYVNLAMQGEAYWLALLCGIDQFVRKGGLDDDNVYLTWLARGLLSRMVDPGMRHLLDNRVALHRWVSGRLHAISRVLQRGDASLFSEIPIAFNTTPSHPDLDALGLSSLAIRGSDEHLSVAMIDGHHRLFAMALLDVERCPMMSVWNPALLQEVPKLKRIRNYEQRMFQYLAGVTVDDPITA